MAPKAAGMFAGSKFPFTEARVEQARKAVLDGLVDTVNDASGLHVTATASTRS